MPISLTSISRVEGLTHGGLLVELTGTDFFIPAAVPTADGKAAPSIQVEFGPFISDAAFAITATRAFAVLPKYRALTIDTLPDTVDVKVTNYDASGNLDLADVDTLSAAFTYRRPGLNTESGLTRVVRDLLIQLMNGIHRNTYWIVDSDYDEMVLDNFTEVAKKPAFILTGPELPENLFYRNRTPCQTGEGSGADIYKGQAPRTIDLVWDFIGVAEDPIQCLNMIDAVYSFFDNTRHLITSDGAQYNMMIEDEGLSVETVVNSSNIHHFTGTFRIVGVQITQSIGEPGIQETKDIFRAVMNESFTKEIEEICLDVAKKV